MTFEDIFWMIVAAGGGGGVVSFAIFKGFGEKWLDSKFANRLQALRHEHERQMESVRLETSRNLDRSTRLSEREFDTSAQAWSLVYDVYSRTMGAMPGLRQQADFTNLEDDLARVVAEKNGFEEWEVEDLLATPKAARNKRFGDHMRVHEMRDAKSAIRDASLYLNKNALFLDVSVYSELKSFVDFAWKAAIAREIVLEAGPGNLDGIRRDDEEFRKGAEAKVAELDKLVRAQFWPPAQSESA